MNTCTHCQSPLPPDGTCPACLLRLALNFKDARVPDDTSEELKDLSTHFPQLEIQRLVGRGGMGSIYQARQTSLDRDIALKVIDRSISNDSNFLDRFEREAKALAQLNHPNIVAIYDFGHTSDGLAYFMMEYVHGLNLREAMQTMPIDVNYALEIVRATADALQYAHSKGIVHRDIKPENILLSDDGRMKLADFGIAKINNSRNDRRITATRQVLGTVHYLAPEQLESPNEVDHRIDIYALGVILYELLTRQVPVGNFEPASQLNPRVPRELDQVILRALHRKPSARFQSAEELNQALAICSDNLPETLQPLEYLAPNPLPVICVPFEAEAMKGFAVVHGTMQITHTGLKLEFQSKDAFFGGLQSKLETIEVPWQRLMRINFRPGILSDTLHISGDSFSLFETFPENESGTISLKVKKRDHDLVQTALEKIRLKRPGLLPITPLASIDSPNINIPVAFGIIVCGILNLAAFLILLSSVKAFGLSEQVERTLEIATVFTLAPLFMTQLACGTHYISTGDTRIGQFGALSCLIPLTPILPLSLPFGWWGITQLGLAPRTNSQLVSPRTPRWGLTTMIFTIESKYATLISILESLCGLLLLGMFLLWTFGVYPAEIKLRYVGQADETAVQSFVKNRLHPFQDVLTHMGSENRLTIKCFRFQREGILDTLRVGESPSLVVCAKEIPEDNSTESTKYLPSLSGTERQNTVSRQVGSNREILAVQEIPIPSQWLVKIEANRKQTLKITWSREGWLRIKELVDFSEEEQVLALKVNGWIEAFSVGAALKDKTTQFEWIQATENNSASIEAALRGPSLPVEFEALN